jgi:hypothetical protein
MNWFATGLVALLMLDSEGTGTVMRNNKVKDPPVVREYIKYSLKVPLFAEYNIGNSCWAYCGTCERSEMTSVSSLSWTGARGDCNYPSGAFSLLFEAFVLLQDD